MASLLKRKGSPSWWVAWSDRGVRRFVSAKTADKSGAALVLAKYAERELNWRHGLSTASEDRLEDAAATPLREHAGNYVANLKAEGRSDQHVEDVRLALELLVAHLGDDAARLFDLDADSVRAFLEARKASEGWKSSRSWNKWRSIAVSFANWLTKTGRLAANPLASVPVAKGAPTVKRRALTADELARLFEAADERGPRVGLWFRLAFYAGLRRGELAKLKWGNVDLDGAVLTITPDVGKAKGRVDRVPLHDALRAPLRAFRPELCTPAALVFGGRPVGHELRRLVFKRAGIATENAAGERVDLHALRATLATNLAAAGAAPITTQRLLRHSSFAVTSAHYVRLGDDALRDGLDLVGTPKHAAPANVVRQAASGEIRQAATDTNSLTAATANRTARGRCNVPGENATLSALAIAENAKTRSAVNSVESPNGSKVARMAELADAPGLESGGAIRGGSTPPPRTRRKRSIAVSGARPRPSEAGPAARSRS